MSKRYRMLTGRLRQMGKNNADLAAWLGITAGSLSHRMTERQEWSLGEMYRALDYIGAQPEELHIYFPRS